MFTYRCSLQLDPAMTPHYKPCSSKFLSIELMKTWISTTHTVFPSWEKISCLFEHGFPSHHMDWRKVLMCFWTGKNLFHVPQIMIIASYCSWYTFYHKSSSQKTSPNRKERIQSFQQPLRSYAFERTISSIYNFILLLRHYFLFYDKPIHRILQKWRRIGFIIP